VVAAGAMCAVCSSQDARATLSATDAGGLPGGAAGPAVVIKKESKLVLVDSVVTDKKGNYIPRLTQNDFKVFEDNKKSSFLFFRRRRYGYPGELTTRYLILFFDNYTMRRRTRFRRGAPTKFHRSETPATDRLMAVGIRGLAPHRARIYGERGRARAGGVGVKSSSAARCKRTRQTDVPVTIAVDRFLITGQCRGGFWGAAECCWRDAA